MAGACGYIGYNLNDWEGQLLISIYKIRVEKGMVPITRQSIVDIPIQLVTKEH